MRIQQIRNAMQKIRYGDQVLLVDPWLQDKGTGFSAPALKPEMAGLPCPLNDLPLSPAEILAGVDFCLVTHIHPDHFTADYLPVGMKLIVQNEADQAHAEAMGFTNVLACTGELSVGSVTITRVPAIHGDNPQVAELMGAVSGYVLRGEAKTLYIAGDTVYYDGVAETLARYKPDVITVNCCEARVPVGRLIMDLPDVALVCQSAPDALVIATHLDSVNHAMVTRADVRAFARANDLCRLRVPADGEWIEP